MDIVPDNNFKNNVTITKHSINKLVPNEDNKIFDIDFSEVHNFYKNPKAIYII